MPEVKSKGRSGKISQDRVTQKLQGVCVCARGEGRRSLEEIQTVRHNPVLKEGGELLNLASIQSI